MQRSIEIIKNGVVELQNYYDSTCLLEFYLEFNGEYVNCDAEVQWNHDADGYHFELQPLRGVKYENLDQQPTVIDFSNEQHKEIDKIVKEKALAKIEEEAFLENYKIEKEQDHYLNF